MKPGLMKEAAPNTTIVPPRRMLLYLNADVGPSSIMQLRGDSYIQRLKVRPENAVKHKIQTLRIGAKFLNALLQLATKLTGDGVTFMKKCWVANVKKV
jgi:hypothetical protein